MTPENMPAPPDATGPAAVLRPPDFFLRQGERSAARRQGEPDIYVSWGGQIYGPTGAEQALAGVRTSYFGDDAVFWFEGQEEWRPVAELRQCPERPDSNLPVAAANRPPPAEPVRPKWPGTRSSASSSAERRRRRKSGSGRSSRGGLAGRLIVIGAVFLAVAVTAGLLILISLV